MADAELPADKVAAYQELFELFDTNKDGTVNTEELGILIRSLGQNPTEKELQLMVQEVDLNKNGTIDFPEFIKLMTTLDRHDLRADTIKEAFTVFDKEGTGVIPSEVLRSAMINLGEGLTEEEVEAMLTIADADGNGMIDYEEFAQFMDSLP